MGEITTHTEGRVVTRRDDGRTPVDVVQLPQRDAAIQAASPAVPDPPAAPTVPVTPATPATAAPAVKAATKRQAARIKTGKR